LRRLLLSSNPGTTFTGKIFKVTIDTKPSNLSAADKKAVKNAEEVAATIEDQFSLPD
jgi:hypothetical protein